MVISGLPSFMRPVNILENLLYSFSTLLFLRSKRVGAILFLTTLLNFNMALSGVISWITTLIFAHFIGIRKGELVHSVYTYNSLIVGFSLGFLFKITWLSILLTIGTSILTVLLSYTLFSILTLRMGLPVLNIPFFIVSTIIYLASSRYSSLFVDSFYVFERLNIEILPHWIHGLLRSAGILLFMPYDITGLLVLTALLVFSRISFFLAVTSYYVGIFSLAMLKGSFTQVYLDFAAFNFILIGISLGGVFLVPSRKTYILAFAGVFASVFILDAVSVVWAVFGIPVFTLPFNLVVLLFIYVLLNSRYDKNNTMVRSSPESSLSAFLGTAQRFDRFTPRPFLPFLGQWRIYQGFEDRWTHKGPWKYAYDFIITDDQGKSHKNCGGHKTDYYCYGKPVVSPVSGIITDTCDSLKDNDIGEVDQVNNWGNYIIIQSAFGYYVEISHLQANSLKLGPGDPVQAGAVLANCGNSGYSPQPHIHMQIQPQARLGSHTVPFYLNNCIGHDLKLKGDDILATGTDIEAITVSRKMTGILTFFLDDRFKYTFSRNQEVIDTLELSVKMEDDGSYYFSCKGYLEKLYFGIESNCFVFYGLTGSWKSPLTLFFLGASKIPLSINEGLSWEDVLPDNLFYSTNGLHLFYKSFNHEAGKITGVYSLKRRQEVTGVIHKGKKEVTTKVVLNSIKGFNQIEVIQNGCKEKLELVSS